MVVDDMDEELAGKLIMKARESWFAEAEAAEVAAAEDVETDKAGSASGA